MNEKFTELQNILNKSNKVAIISHINPDGDCLGSAVGLGLHLKSIGKSVDFFCDDEIHTNFSFLTKDYFNPEFKNNYDLLISVDCSDLGRMGQYGDYYKTHINTINIDHHKTNTNFAKFNLVIDNASSTCEILYDYINYNNIIISDKVAQALYSGLMTDTGCFLHNNTTPHVHVVASELLKYNIDLDTVHYYLNKRKTLKQLRLLQVALKSLTLYNDNKISMIKLTQEDFKVTDTTEKEVIGVVNYAVNLDDVEIAVLMSECVPNCFQISFRSKGKCDVSILASAFGGGGHKMAAGCKICGKLENVVDKILKEAQLIL